MRGTTRFGSLGFYASCAALVLLPLWVPRLHLLSPLWTVCDHEYQDRCTWYGSTEGRGDGTTGMGLYQGDTVIHFGLMHHSREDNQGIEITIPRLLYLVS